MDYSKLSKEELIALLSTGNVSSHKDTCPYESKNVGRCKNEGEKKYHGFCSRHKNTVQAKNAQKEHEEAKVEEKPETEVEEEIKKNEPAKNEEEPAKDEQVDDDSAEESEEDEEPKSLVAKRNKWGYHEHKETKMCFDPHTKRVVGRMNHRKGRLYALTEKDKEVCDEYGMQYSDSDSDEE